jgi:hypothetical protein
MKISLLAVIAAALTLTGCTTLPKSLKDNGPPVSAAEIFRAIACEFVLAAQTHPSVYQTGATIDLTVDKTDEATLAPSAEWSASMNGFEVTSTPSANASTKLTNKVTIRHAMKIVADAAPEECAADPTTYSRGLGLAGELRTQMAIIEGVAAQDEFKDMTITRTVTVRHTAGGTLAFTIASVKVKFDGSEAYRENVHTITIGLEPIRGAGDADRAQKDIQQRLDLESEQQRLVEILRDATQTGAPV